MENILKLSKRIILLFVAFNSIDATVCNTVIVAIIIALSSPVIAIRAD